MESPVLNNPNQFPTEDIIFSSIGKNKSLWESFFGHIHENHPEISEEWRYYNDGKSWLLKVTSKSKTIFWLSIIGKSFRATFYFPVKAEEAIFESKISDDLKNQYRDKKGNKIRGITINFKNKKDINFAKELLEIKLTI